MIGERHTPGDLVGSMFSSNMADELKVNGIYEHYKGKRYKIIALAIDSDTDEEVVVYQGLYDHEQFGHNPMFTRKKSIFLKTEFVDGKEVPRFKLIE
jgi:hypothetical protein